MLLTPVLLTLLLLTPVLLTLLLLNPGLLSPVSASPSFTGNDSISVEYFYEEGCLKCEQATPVLSRVVENYPGINYSAYEIKSSYPRMKEYGLTTVPAVVVNGSTAITYADYEGDEAVLEALLAEAIENPAPSPFRKIEPRAGAKPPGNEGKPETIPEKMNPFFVLAAGILAGFNPCLLAVMVFLASVTLSRQGGKKEMLKITAGFSAGIFAMYMLAGMSILGTVRLIPGVREALTTFLVLLTGFIGLWHIYDAYRLKVHAKSTFRTPKYLKNFMNTIGEKNLLLLSFLAGGMFSLVKAPCVGAIYLSILNMLVTKTGVMEGTVYLALYNLGLVLPVIGLGVLLTVGLSPEAVTEFREKRRVEIRLVTGLVLLALALLLQFKII